MKNDQVIIVGAGMAGLSAAITIAKDKKKVILISQMPSERAQSVMAEGGINGALNTKGEQDSTKEHYFDTMRAGVGLADPEAVRNMTNKAPHIIEWLYSLGVEFNMDENKNIDLRYFGGQKKRRTAFAGSCTGKQIMTALIQETRKYEKLGYIERLSHHTFCQLILENKCCVGCIICDNNNDTFQAKLGRVILATGGMNGLFGKTTGSILNTGEAVAKVFLQGAKAANLEMIQYHPTTCLVNGKRGLISEAARGEGGRLFTYDHSKKLYFMEEKYPELKNLMPRDVVSKEIWKVCNEQKTDHVYLDLTEIPDKVFETKLSELEEMANEYLKIDPRKNYLTVYPGIHYFMGGLYIDKEHRTQINGLFAAGECACQYHGANRLGGNSLLGAIYGGMTAANTILKEVHAGLKNIFSINVDQEVSQYINKLKIIQRRPQKISVNDMKKEFAHTMNEHMGIVRSGQDMQLGLKKLDVLINKVNRGYDASVSLCENESLRALIILGQAVIKSGIARKESRGAHARTDFVNTDPIYQKTTIACYCNESIAICFDSINKE